jgi:hypothetical protein
MAPLLTRANEQQPEKHVRQFDARPDFLLCCEFIFHQSCHADQSAFYAANIALRLRQQSDRVIVPLFNEWRGTPIRECAKWPNAIQLHETSQSKITLMYRHF